MAKCNHEFVPFKQGGQTVIACKKKGCGQVQNRPGSFIDPKLAKEVKRPEANQPKKKSKVKKKK